jgi:DNA (cytosine-5)-methyltransferase 1
VTSRAETGLALPAFIAELRGGSCDAHAVTDPLSTLTASGHHHALISSYFRIGVGARPVEEPLSTVTTVERHPLITPAGGTWRKQATPAHEPVPTRPTRESDGIAFGPVVDLSDIRFRMLEPSEVAAAMDFPSAHQWIGTRRIQVRWRATRTPRQLPAT